MNLTAQESELVYIKNLFMDNDSGLSADNKGTISIRQRGQLRKIGFINFEKGVLTYHQKESYSHLLKAWNAWTIDKIIYSKLPENAILKYYVPDGIFEYSKAGILKLEEDTKNGTVPLKQPRYEERVFAGHGLRIILPVFHSTFVSQKNDLKNIFQ